MSINRYNHRKISLELNLKIFELKNFNFMKRRRKKIHECCLLVSRY